MTRLDPPRPLPKVARSVAETIGQAQTWDLVSARYRAVGFCNACAAQAAWGHQLGFTTVKPPCLSCAGLTPPDGPGARVARWTGEPTPDTRATEHPDRPRGDAAGTCGGCDHVWTGLGAAHCAARGCHRTFSTTRLFDLHRSTRGGEHGTCADPEKIRNRDGEPTMFFRDGMWRGPEMTDEQKLARFGEPSSA